MSGLFNDKPRPTGTSIERELRRQSRERARRGGPSTAALEARVWFELVQDLADLPVNRIVTDHEDVLVSMTGIKSRSKLRALVTAARETKGMRLRLGSWGGFAGEADRDYSQAAQDAEAEDARHRAAMAAQGNLGGPNINRRFEQDLRDAVVRNAAQGQTAGAALIKVNQALAENGFSQVSERQLRRILKKSADLRRFSDIALNGATNL